MRIVVLATGEQKKELLQQNPSVSDIEFLTGIGLLKTSEAPDVVIDLLFQPSHLADLQALTGSLVIINSVVERLGDGMTSFVRINAWPTFLEGPVVEAAGKEAYRQKAEAAFARFHKQLAWVDDVPGLISARVVAMIINEAHLALQEGVSTPAHIDTAMKLGTNYPYGPLEWEQKIGPDRVRELLETMSK